MAETIKTVNEKAARDLKERVIFRLAGIGNNRAALERIPHLETLNLAAVFLKKRSGALPKTAAGPLSDEDFLPVTFQDTEKTGLSIPELFRASLQNMVRALPPRGEDLLRLIGRDPVPGADLGLFVLTNQQDFYGASVMFYPGLLKGIAEYMNGSFYVIPSSVHEVILAPEERLGTPIPEMNRLIREVNRTDVMADEVLSETLYYYDRQEDEIVIA
jgi:hypothetical protein